MKKDIEIPKAEGLYLAVLHEYHPDFEDKIWQVYLLNRRKEAIETILVLSRGADQERKTSVIRRSIDSMAPDTLARLEYLPDDLLSFRNEYLVTFFHDGKMYEKNFLLEPGMIGGDDIPKIASLGKKGYLIS
ncbi:hypothetical protein [Robertkochia aurantiaca]|uniref:hypothetical protein n=1 Tax=Robertkochia aurantiaca TaxID=2873700 RepID=UPI001CCAEE6D|nr:hypothetical protein [Robertkochia sp. 3YJGBD-33]